MISTEFLQGLLGLTLALPLLSLLILTIGISFGFNLTERRIHQLLGVELSLGLLSASLFFISLLCGWIEPFSVDLGTLIAAGSYDFGLVFHLDILGAMFLWLTMALVGLVGAFSANYLHQDEGFIRFYWLLLAFVIGLEIIATAERLDLVFVGWELLGISSALLIAYFIRRKGPVENGLRAFAAYRITDVGLLCGIVTLHHLSHTTSISALARIDSTTALMVGGFFVFGAMGKGAIVPFTPWLPRAMEGPTPSSAIFYGALSIHASPFLLLRLAPLFDQHLVLREIIFTLGIITAIHASMVGRVQNDIKCSLAYAAVAQVGVMWMFIGLGFYKIAAFHLFGHTVIRTWQLLRSPSILHERHQLLNLLGKDLNPTGRHLERLLPLSVQRWAYRVALERWYLNELWDIVAGFFMSILKTIDRVDRRWSSFMESESAGYQEEKPQKTLTGVIKK